MNTSVHPVARQLFEPLAPNYERWGKWLSLGQDGRCRRSMVRVVDPVPGSLVLDVAAGTGSITRLLASRGAVVISLDQSPEMLGAAVERGAVGVLATGEALPFADETFDALTFGHLLRYVHDVERCLAELIRVVRPGGTIGMVEFGRPTGPARPAWWLYTRTLLPLAGALIGSGWQEVGSFLGPSIDDFADRYPPERLVEAWQRTGLQGVRFRKVSFGGELVMWGTKR